MSESPIWPHFEAMGTTSCSKRSQKRGRGETRIRSERQRYNFYPPRVPPHHVSRVTFGHSFLDTASDPHFLTQYPALGAKSLKSYAQRQAKGVPKSPKWRLLELSKDVVFIVWEPHWALPGEVG